MNSVNIIGRLVRDPEVKRNEDGLTICNLRLAIDDNFSKEDRSDFISVTVFGNQAGICERYLRKGFMAGVTGRIRSDIYTDSEGIKRYPIKLVADRVQILQWPERKESRNGESAPIENAAPVSADNETGMAGNKADEEPAEYTYAASENASGQERSAEAI